MLEDGIALPYNRVSLMHDAGLDQMALRDLRDLVVDDTVAFITAVVLVCRIMEDFAYRILNRVEIALAVNQRIFVLAYRDTLYAFRSGIDGQVDAVDTIRVVHGLVGILILLGLADRMLQVLTAP